MLAQNPPGGRRLRALVLLILGGILALVVAGFRWIDLPRLFPIAGRGGVARKSTAPFVGPRSCGECHPGESALFARSGHAQTLRPAAAVPLARKLDGTVVADPEVPGVRWAYERRGDHFGAARQMGDGSIERFVLDYAFGSDHHATTFVSLADSKRLPATEHRLTHYSDGDIFRVTPGQGAARPYPGTKPHGRELPDWEALACFRCHATRTSASGPDLLRFDEMIPNVSCERCHGPATDHLAAARAGSAIPPMPFGPERWTADAQMTLCGKCHRHPSETFPGGLRPDRPSLARFQPVGIMQSKCYQASAGALSCVSCHDPHARASTDLGGYEATCLSCHKADPQVVCRVSPGGDCLRCHMPLVDTGQRVLFTDHWIRVRTASDPPVVARTRPGGRHP